MRPFMPRDNNKNNDSRGRRDRPSGGRGRSGVPRGPEKKFAKRGFGGKAEGERRPYAGKRDDRPSRSDDRNAPRARTDRPYADRPSRSGEGEKRTFRPPEDRGGDKRPYSPRGEGFRKGSDRPRGDRPFNARPREGDRPRGDRSFADRPERKFGGDKKFSPDRGGIATASLGVPKAAPIGRSTPEASHALETSIGPVGTMRMIAKSLPNGRPLVGAALIASATATIAGLRVRQRSRNPASVSPRSSLVPGLPRAATPRNGSCRGASR